MKCSQCRRKIDGKTVYLAFGTDRCRMCDVLAGGAEPGAAHPAGWPMTSLALSVHKSQVAEATERNRRHGITGVEYDAAGTCTVSSPTELAKLHKLEGVHFNNNVRGPGV